MKHVTKVGENGFQLTGAILSYPHLFEARSAAKGSPPKFSAQVIFPKTMDDEDWTTINEMVNEQIMKRFPKGAPADLQMPWKDAGDKAPEYAGHFAVSAGAQIESPPQVVKEDPTQQASPGEIYAGIGVNVYLAVFAYDTAGNRGIAVGLNAVQIADRTLPRIDGRKAASQVFGAVSAPASVPGVTGPAGAATAPGSGHPPQVNPTPHSPTPANKAPVIPGSTRPSALD